MEYSYILQNLDSEKHQELQEKIQNVKGVIFASVFKEEEVVKLTYSLQETASEYDVFVEVDKLLQEYNADIVFENEKPLTFNDEEKEVKEEKSEKSKKSKLPKLPDYTFRLFQIVLAALMYWILGTKAWVVYTVGLVLASYEIFYDTITDITKKKITDNLVVCISIIFLALFNKLNEAFILAISFSLIKVGYMAFMSVLRRKNNELCFIEKFELADGEEVELENITEGLKINVSGKIYLPCEIEDGTSQVKRLSGLVEDVKEGDKLYEGDTILNKQILQVKILQAYNDSSLKEKRELQQKFLNEIDSIKPNKKQNLICLSLALAALLYVFIKPLFMETEYLYSLSTDSIKAIVILAFSFPLVEFWNDVRIELLRYKIAKNIYLLDLNKLFKLVGTSSFVYNENVFYKDGKINEDAYGLLREVKDLGISKQTAVSNSETLNETCNQLKLKNRVNSLSGENYESAIKDSFLFDNGNAFLNGEKVFSFEPSDIRSIPKTLRRVIKAKQLKGWTFALVIASQVVFMLLALSGLLNIFWCLLGGIILSGLLGLMQLLMLVEL